MKKRKMTSAVDLAVLTAMAALALTPMFGLNASGISVILGIAYYFIQRRLQRTPKEESGLCLMCIPKAFQKKSIWLWIALPLVFDTVSLVLSKEIAPGYLDHIFERSAAIISYGDFPKLIPQLIVLALGEEIAFRALFQEKLSTFMPEILAIIVASLFFALSHLTQGSREIVVYDLIFVFLNSIVYGILYHKTKNAYVSTLSHIVSNLFGVIFILIAR